MLVLGIDPGLTRTGFGLATRGPKAISAGVLATSPDDRMEDRLAELHRDLTALIAEFQPDVVAMERVFTNRNLQTTIAVGRASGVAMLAAAQAGLRVFEYTPSAVKLAAAGDGNADKKMIQRMVVRRFGLEAAPRPADASDALAIALCHLQSARFEVRS